MHKSSTADGETSVSPMYTVNRQCFTVILKVNPECIKTCLVDEEMDFHDWSYWTKGGYFETVNDTISLLRALNIYNILPTIK